MIKISVIIPIYNGEKYIKKCIQGIQRQTLREFEVLLINDGSMDNSGQVCDYLSKGDNRLKVIHQKNLGVSKARNKGINEANGNYICFIDCDDYIESNYLESLYNACIKNDADISMCSVKSINENNKVISIKKMEERNYSSIEALEELFQFRNLNWGPCGKLFSKNLLKKQLEFPMLHAYEDLIFCYKAIYYSKKVVFTKECEYYYVHRKGVGAMEKFIKEPTTDVIVAAYEVLDFIKKKAPDIWDKSFYGIISQVIMYIGDINKIDESWRSPKSKQYITETKKILAYYRKEIIANTTVLKSEKVMFIILSYSSNLYRTILMFNRKFRELSI